MQDIKALMQRRKIPPGAAVSPSVVEHSYVKTSSNWNKYRLIREDEEEE